MLYRSKPSAIHVSDFFAKKRYCASTVFFPKNQLLQIFTQLFYRGFVLTPIQINIPSPAVAIHRSTSQSKLVALAADKTRIDQPAAVAGRPRQVHGKNLVFIVQGVISSCESQSVVEQVKVDSPFNGSCLLGL